MTKIICQLNLIPVVPPMFLICFYWCMDVIMYVLSGVSITCYEISPVKLKVCVCMYWKTWWSANSGLVLALSLYIYICIVILVVQCSIHYCTLSATVCSAICIIILEGMQQRVGMV